MATAPPTQAIKSGRTEKAQDDGGISQFDGRDRWVVLAMAGIPTILHVALVWIPTIASIFLSFTELEGDSLRRNQLGRPQELRSNLHRLSAQLLPGTDQQHRVLLIFLFVFPTALGMLLAYMLDRDIRCSRFYQSIFFTPVVLSLAVVGFMWQERHLFARKRPRHARSSAMVKRWTGSATNRF